MTDMLALEDMSELPTATVTALVPAQATTSSGNICDNTSSNQNWSSAVLAVPVGSNPAYHARSMSMKRDKARRKANQVVPGDDSQATTSNANARVGVSEAFLEDFLTRVLPQFGLTRQALTMLSSCADSCNCLAAETKKDWELVEAEVDTKQLPDEIHADTPLLVRVKGDPDAKWMDFLKARDVALVQTSDIVDFVVKPITQWKDGRLLSEQDRNTYVEHVADVHPKGRDWVERYCFGVANIFVSHAWMDSYQDFSDAMTGGSSQNTSASNWNFFGSNHFHVNRAQRILDMSSLGNLIDDYLVRAWRKDDSAAWWQMRAWWRLAPYVSSIFKIPLTFVTLLWLFSGAFYVVHILPIDLLVWIVSQLRLLGLTDRRNRRWVDIFCKNQWIVNSGDTQQELEDGVGNVDKLWLVTHSWQNPQALKRTWCQFELRAARVNNVKIVGIARHEEEKQLRALCSALFLKWWFWASIFNPFSSLNVFPNPESVEFKRLRNALKDVDANKAEARFEQDKRDILDLIRKGVSHRYEQGEAAISAHNDEVRDSYLNLISEMMDGFVGTKIKDFLRMTLLQGIGLIIFAMLVPIKKNEHEQNLMLGAGGLLFSCAMFIIIWIDAVQEQVKQYFVQPLRPFIPQPIRQPRPKMKKNNKEKAASSESNDNETEEEKKDSERCSLIFSLLCITPFFVFFSWIVHEAPSLGVPSGCAAYPLANISTVSACTFEATSAAPQFLLETNQNGLLGTYYQMPNSVVNGKPVFEAYITEYYTKVDLGTRMNRTVCHKKYLYYSDSDKWIVSDFEYAEIGKHQGWIFSKTTHVASPAWLPADERWELWHWKTGKWYNGAVHLTCRNQPAAPPPPSLNSSSINDSDSSSASS
ncbi:hypothetical protein RI054_44g153160 [Pseudoscourfieldia marina]